MRWPRPRANRSSSRNCWTPSTRISATASPISTSAVTWSNEKDKLDTDCGRHIGTRRDPAGRGVRLRFFRPGRKPRRRPLEIATLLTLISLAPAVLIMLTSFTRIVIVLSLLRQALGLQQTPPNIVITGLAL